MHEGQRATSVTHNNAESTCIAGASVHCSEQDTDFGRYGCVAL